MEPESNLLSKKTNEKIISSSKTEKQIVFSVSDGKCCNNYPAPLNCVQGAWTLATDAGEKNITDCNCQSIYSYYGLPYGDDMITLQKRGITVPGDLVDYLHNGDIVISPNIQFSQSAAYPAISFTPREYPLKGYRITKISNGSSTVLGTVYTNSYVDYSTNLTTSTAPAAYEVTYLNWGGEDRHYSSNSFNPIAGITVSEITGPSEVYSPRRLEPNTNVQYSISVSNGCGQKQITWYERMVSSATKFGEGTNVTYSASYQGNDVNFYIDIIAIIKDECNNEVRKYKTIHLCNTLECR